jgi:hypothetical protein
MATMDGIIRVHAAHAIKVPAYANDTRAPSAAPIHSVSTIRVPPKTPWVTILLRHATVSLPVRPASIAGRPIYFTADFQSYDQVDLYSVNCDTLTISKLNYPAVIQPYILETNSTVKLQMWL